MIGARVRVLVFAPSFAPAVKAGGPARSLTNLAREAAQNHDVTVVTHDRDHLDSVPFPGLSGRWAEVGGSEVFYLNPRSVKQWRTLLRSLPSRRFDLVLLNSIWNWGFSLVPATLLVFARLRGPAVLMPRGELEFGALALKSRKKKLLWPLFAALYRRVVSAIGVTSESEAGNVRARFPGTRVLVTTNLPDRVEFGVPDDPHDELQAVGLGRVHPTKGLLPLLAGLARVEQPVHLRWYGAIGDPAYWRQCTAAIERLPAHVTFEYGGEARREAVPEVLHNSDLMILLTAGENYGHVIAEALQAGCPVLATGTTPWTSTLREGGGGIVDDREDADAVSIAVERWAELDERGRSQARLEARRAFERFASTQPTNIIELGLRTVAQSYSEERLSNG
mgnify:CR=1 FL=1